MAEILPFRGILYDTEKLADPSKILAPPYDVIDERGRAELAARHENNCVRLILPEGEGDDKYQNAATTLDSWLGDGTLKRDDRPAIYRYHQSFTAAELGGRTITRRGFIAAVKLRRYDEGGILPHERTLRGPKVDRLKLMRAARAHFSQIFTMYSDPSGETDRLFRDAEDSKPYLVGTTDDGATHTVWKVHDREVIGQLCRRMAPLDLYIADGHHRYETMLALRDELESEHGPLSLHSAAQYGTMFVANMDDAGTVVLPTHRLVHSVEGFAFDEFLARAGQYFDVETLEGAARDAAVIRGRLAEAHAGHHAFVAVAPGAADAHLMTLKATVDLAKLGVAGHPSVLKLDVTVLHALILERLLGIDQEAQDAKTNLHYVSESDEALERIHGGDAQVGFFMNPTPPKQVRAVANAHEVMPQKSTFFFPKIASGVVINPVDPGEELY